MDATTITQFWKIYNLHPKTTAEVLCDLKMISMAVTDEKDGCRVLIQGFKDDKFLNTYSRLKVNTREYKSSLCTSSEIS